MDLPTIKGDADPFFDRRECRVCGARGLHEPNSFAVLDGGAMVPMGDGGAAPVFDALAWFGMSWHGAHSDMKGTGQRPDTGGSVKVVDDCSAGQFAIYFCSTACLRKFLNACVDELEQRIR
jgi:hypothetical protein